MLLALIYLCDIKYYKNEILINCFIVVNYIDIF